MLKVVVFSFKIPSSFLSNLYRQVQIKLIKLYLLLFSVVEMMIHKLVLMSCIHSPHTDV